MTLHLVFLFEPIHILIILCLVSYQFSEGFFFTFFVPFIYSIHFNFLQLWDTVNKWSREITPSIDNSTNNDNVQIKDDINQVEKIVQPNKSAIADALTKQVEVQENNEHPEDIKNEVEAIEKKGIM